MWKDPIVEELHALRAQMTQAVGGDMHRYAQQLRESQQQRLAARAQLSQPSNRQPSSPIKRSLS
jgi:hypothetical protein